MKWKKGTFLSFNFWYNFKQTILALKFNLNYLIVEIFEISYGYLPGFQREFCIPTSKNQNHVMFLIYKIPFAKIARNFDLWKKI